MTMFVDMRKSESPPTKCKGVQDLVAQFRANYFTFHRNTFSKKYFSKNNLLAETAQEGAKCISGHESFF